MRNLVHDHALPVLGALLVAAFCFFMLSASGQPGTFWSDGPGWLGTIGWFTFLALVLLFVLTAVYAVVLGVRRRAVR